MLSDKIWLTRKARIYAEQRLQRKAILSLILITVYSFSLLSLSIWNLLYSNHIVNLFLVFGSIAVLISSIVLLSQKYTERSIMMRNCYIRLDEIYSKAKRAEHNNDLDMLQQLESEYASTLLNVENHSEYDYLCLRYSLRHNPQTTLPPFTSTDCLRYFWEKSWRIALIFLYFALPLFLVGLWSAAQKNVSI